MRVGSAEVGGLIELVEWDPGRDLAWTSVTGIDQRGRWRLRDAARSAPASSSVCIRRAGGGLWGWLADKFAGPIVRGERSSSTLQQLKRTVEHEQLRVQAARRRAART